MTLHIICVFKIINSLLKHNRFYINEYQSNRRKIYDSRIYDDKYIFEGSCAGTNCYLFYFSWISPYVLHLHVCELCQQCETSDNFGSLHCYDGRSVVPVNCNLLFGPKRFPHDRLSK